jgi:ElaB/YqjD/DUF883 family membrane-anchored ribosome-binding protein
MSHSLLVQATSLVTGLASAKSNPTESQCLQGIRLTDGEWNMTATIRLRGRTAAKDFSDSITEANALLQQAANETGKRASDLLSEVGAKVLAAKSVLRDLPDEAVERATAAARDTDDYVRGKPWQAIGVAAAIAFVVGVLVSRR